MATSTPTLDGIHHLQIAVTHLDASLAWWEQLFGAERQEYLDHAAPDGFRSAYILLIPGVNIPLQLVLDPEAAKAGAGLDPMALAVATELDLYRWAERLDEIGTPHSPVLRGFVGWLLILRDPDGLSIRLYSRETHEWDPTKVDHDATWMAPPAAGLPANG